MKAAAPVKSHQATKGGKQPPAPPRLLFVVNNASFFLSHRLPIARAARAAGFDVHIATPEGADSRKIAALEFPFHAIRMNRGGVNPLGAVAAVASLFRLYRRLRPDIVHHVTIKPVLLGGLSARLARVPGIVHAISGLGHVFGGGKSIRARCLRSVAVALYSIVCRSDRVRVIFQNDDDRACLVDAGAVSASDVRMIRGSGVDLGEFQPTSDIPSDPPMILLPARMLRDKGVGEFVDMARQLRARGVAARCVLCGPTDEANPSSLTVAELNSLNNEDGIEWWGNCHDMPAVFSQSSIVCLPSYKEGLPKSLLEAAAAGRPIVTTDTPGCRPAVEDGVTGLLVPPRDANALTDAIAELLRDPYRMVQMGRAARQLAKERFDIRDVQAKTLAIYEDLLSAKGSGCVNELAPLEAETQSQGVPPVASSTRPLGARRFMKKVDS